METSDYPALNTRLKGPLKMSLHFTRIPGCEKGNSTYRFAVQHYEYFGTFKIIPYGTEVIVVPCNNCNDHKINSKECELILESENNIHGISFKRNSKNADFFIDNETSLLSILNDYRINFNPTIFNKEAFFRTCENEYETPICPKLLQWKNEQKFIDYELPPVKKITYLSLFCPVPEKSINIICNSSDIFRARYGTFIDTKELAISVKYGWNNFHICSYYYQTNHEWLMYTKPLNEILQVPCNKTNFKMYILNDKRTAPSLLDLSFSSLYQHNLNTALNTTNYILPTTLCQQAPPCYFYHLGPFAVSSNKCRYNCNIPLKRRSSHISDW